MTKRNVARSRTRTKVSAEMPPDSQVRRVARRVSIEPRDTIPTPAVEPIDQTVSELIARVETTEPLPALRAMALRQLSKRIQAAADDCDPMKENRDSAQERYHSHLSRVVTGALWVDDEEGGINADQALMHLASCQAKAILVAASEGGNPPHSDMWSPDLEFTHEELLVCLGGLAALLRSGPAVIKEMRQRGTLKSSMQQPEVFDSEKHAIGRSS